MHGQYMKCRMHHVIIIFSIDVYNLPLHVTYEQEMGEIMNKEREQLVSQVSEQDKQQQQQERATRRRSSGGNDALATDAAQSFIPATELPHFSNQILLMSIMQYAPLTEAKRISVLENDPSNNKSVTKEGICAIKAVVTTDGVLHIFLLEDKEKNKTKNKDNEDTPFRSLLLENCKIVRHFEDEGKDKSEGHLGVSFANAVEVHPRMSDSSSSGDWFSSSSSREKEAALVLIPIDSVESEKWVDVLTDPALCGADMLYSALEGRKPGHRASSAYSRRASATLTSRATAVTPATSSSSESSSYSSGSSKGDQPSDEDNMNKTQQSSDREKPQPQSTMTSLFPSVDI